ncbi:MAG: hypothetical protein WKF77_04460 [Planctomycetaceae bacterium]
MKPDQLPDKLIVIGNGPSLRHFNLHSLAGVTTLGMNAAYRHWDRIGWYPDIYCCLDDEMISTHWREIKRLVDNGLVKHAFLTGHFARLVPESINDDRYYFLDSFVEHWHHNRGMSLGIPFIGHPVFASTAPGKLTTGSYAVRYAAMCGYNHIALIGIDLRYVQQIPESRSLGGITLKMAETPSHNPNYFFDDYQQAGDTFQIPDPAAHNGNLHLASFESLRNDMVEFKWNVEIVNTNLQSALHESGVFPYQSLEKFLGRSLLGAVIVPTRAEERNAILNNLWLWDQPACAPFIHMRDREPPRLVFCFNNETGRTIEPEIVKAFEGARKLRQYFSSLECRYLSLHGDDDMYFRSGSRHVGEQGYKAGPNNQFFDIIRTAGELGKYVFYMETDCIPIRPDWLGQLLDLVQHAEPFWVMGSIYRGRGVLERAFSRHINGNAVYAAGDAGFQEFVQSVWRPVLQGIAARDPRYAYDMVVETIFDDARSNRANDRVWRLTQSVIHKWRHTDFIHNYSGPTDQESLVPELVQAILASSPTPHLVHGQVFLAAVQRLRENADARWLPTAHAATRTAAAEDARGTNAVENREPLNSGGECDATTSEFLNRYGAARMQYERLVIAIHDFVNANLPLTATVAVVSKGDENLLRLGDRRSWHFPRGGDGAYAGHYPADDTAALCQLAALKEMGADFLVVPWTSFWWFKYYSEFGQHLFLNYRVLVPRDMSAVIFNLTVGTPEPVEQIAARRAIEIWNSADMLPSEK